MNIFDPGDIVCLKEGVSPEMMVIGEVDGAVTVFWQDSVGEGITEELPAASLETIALESSHLSASIRRVAELLRRK
jgi:uncharacterized protein YodC (DUF2158 family)